MRFHHFPEIVNIDWEEGGWNGGREGGGKEARQWEKTQLTFLSSAQKRNSQEQSYLGGLAN